MMKVFGTMLYQYNFPACFLFPFMGEAVFTIFLPYHLGYRIVRSRSISRLNAETCLAPLPMDLARYGDILTNVVLTTLAFFTSSGWLLWTFSGLLVGNIFIYAFDHCRVLRAVESCCFASMTLERVAHRLLAI